MLRLYNYFVGAAYPSGHENINLKKLKKKLCNNKLGSIHYLEALKLGGFINTWRFIIL